MQEAEYSVPLERLAGSMSFRAYAGPPASAGGLKEQRARHTPSDVHSLSSAASALEKSMADV